MTKLKNNLTISYISIIKILLYLLLLNVLVFNNFLEGGSILYAVDSLDNSILPINSQNGMIYPIITDNSSSLVDFNNSNALTPYQQQNRYNFTYSERRSFFTNFIFNSDNFFIRGVNYIYNKICYLFSTIKNCSIFNNYSNNNENNLNNPVQFNENNNEQPVQINNSNNNNNTSSSSSLSSSSPFLDVVGSSSSDELFHANPNSLNAAVSAVYDNDEKQNKNELNLNSNLKDNSSSSSPFLNVVGSSSSDELFHAEYDDDEKLDKFIKELNLNSDLEYYVSLLTTLNYKNIYKLAYFSHVEDLVADVTISNNLKNLISLFRNVNSYKIIDQPLEKLFFIKNFQILLKEYSELTNEIINYLNDYLLINSDNFSMSKQDLLKEAIFKLLDDEILMNYYYSNDENKIFIEPSNLDLLFLYLKSLKDNKDLLRFRELYIKLDIRDRADRAYYKSYRSILAYTKSLPKVIILEHINLLINNNIDVIILSQLIKNDLNQISSNEYSDFFNDNYDSILTSFPSLLYPEFNSNLTKYFTEARLKSCEYILENIVESRFYENLLEVKNIDSNSFQLKFLQINSLDMNYITGYHILFVIKKFLILSMKYPNLMQTCMKALICYENTQFGQQLLKNSIKDIILNEKLMFTESKDLKIILNNLKLTKDSEILKNCVGYNAELLEEILKKYEDLNDEEKKKDFIIFLKELPIYLILDLFAEMSLIGLDILELNKIYNDFLKKLRNRE